MSFLRLTFPEKNRGSAARRGSIIKFYWRGISSKNGMPVFSGANLIGGLVFGSIGFVAFIYGKRMHVWKLVKEIMVAAKLGGAEPAGNPRLAAVVEKARKASVSRDVIERAIKKGAGIGDDKLVMEHVVFEGYAPNKVPIIVEVLTDNNNRTAPEIRVLFKKGGQLGAPGSNKFLFDHVGLVDAHYADPNADIEAAAIEAGAQNVDPLSPAQNDDIPEGTTGARFITEPGDLHSVTQWLASNGWNVVTSELGYIAKSFPELTEEQRQHTGGVLQTLEDHDDVHRVWAAIK